MKRIIASADRWKVELRNLLDRGELRTDSDVDDYIAQNHLDAREVTHQIAQWAVSGTPCEGCKHVEMYPDMAPCVNCSRCKKDYYER